MRWHTLYPDIVNLHLGLNELGCIVYNGEVVVVDPDEKGEKGCCNRQNLGRHFEN